MVTLKNEVTSFSVSRFITTEKKNYYYRQIPFDVKVCEFQHSNLNLSAHDMINSTILGSASHSDNQECIENDKFRR